MNIKIYSNESITSSPTSSESCKYIDIVGWYGVVRRKLSTTSEPMCVHVLRLNSELNSSQPNGIHSTRQNRSGDGRRFLIFQSLKASGDYALKYARVSTLKDFITLTSYGCRTYVYSPQIIFANIPNSFTAYAAVEELWKMKLSRTSTDLPYPLR